MDFVAAGASVRSRLLPFLVGTYDHHLIQYDPVAHDYIYVPAWKTASIIGSQYTASKDHSREWRLVRGLLRQRKRFWSEGETKSAGHGLAVTGFNRQRLKNLDIGGSFYTKRNTYDQTHPWVQGQGGSTGVMNYYTGPLCARSSGVSPASTTWPTLPSYDTQLLAALQMGGAAIADTVPTAPVTSLANFVGELYRDGIPDVIGHTMRRGVSLDSLSREYLNYEFGWKPLVSDLTKLAHVILRSKDLIDQYERDSGKNITRRRIFPPISQTTISSYNPWPVQPALRLPTFASGKYQGPGTKTSVSTTDYWFTATYSYFLNFGEDNFSKFQHAVSIAEKLLGFEITPEVVWNLAPWTWLIDWFVNIGDVFTNASAFAKDGLLMRRGYIMCRNSTVDTYTLDGIQFGISGAVGRISQSFGTETKIRHRAYPFGFGLTMGTLTPRQWAILAALGITQGSIGR